MSRFHGLRETRTYNSWHQMKQRAFTHTATCSKRYVEKGITVCERWLDFKNFYEDMGDRPEGTSLDRIDNDKGYYKENCRWADITTQNRNRSPVLYLTYKGITKTRLEWSQEYKIDYSTLKKRLVAGWSLEKSLNTPVNTKYCNKGKTPSAFTADTQYELEYMG